MLSKEKGREPPKTERVLTGEGGQGPAGEVEGTFRRQGCYSVWEELQTVVGAVAAEGMGLAGPSEAALWGAWRPGFRDPVVRDRGRGPGEVMTQVRPGAAGRHLAGEGRREFLRCSAHSRSHSHYAQNTC